MIDVFFIKTASETLKKPLKTRVFCLNISFIRSTPYLCLNVFLHPSLIPQVLDLLIGIFVSNIFSGGLNYVEAS